MKRTKGNIGWTMLLVALLLSATVCMLTACSSDDTNTTSSPTNNPSEIRMNANVWQVMEGTRATIINPGAVNGRFMVYAYYSTTTENYINGEVVNYSSGVSSWVNMVADVLLTQQLLEVVAIQHGFNLGINA